MEAASDLTRVLVDNEGGTGDDRELRLAKMIESHFAHDANTPLPIGQLRTALSYGRSLAELRSFGVALTNARDQLRGRGINLVNDRGVLRLASVVTSAGQAVRMRRAARNKIRRAINAAECAAAEVSATNDRERAAIKEAEKQLELAQRDAIAMHMRGLQRG